MSRAVPISTPTTTHAIAQRYISIILDANVKGDINPIMIAATEIRSGDPRSSELKDSITRAYVAKEMTRKTTIARPFSSSDHDIRHVNGVAAGGA